MQFFVKCEQGKKAKLDEPPAKMQDQRACEQQGKHNGNGLSHLQKCRISVHVSSKGNKMQWFEPPAKMQDHRACEQEGQL